MTAPATPAATPSPASEPTHPCLRCGRPVPVHVSLCDDCNPLGLKQPAATQVHAIAAGGVVLAVVILAILARIGLAGVGPFTGVAGDTVPAETGLAMTVTVTNHGTKDGATTCRVREAFGSVGGPTEVVQTPVVPAGQTITFTATLSAFGDAARAMAVDCQSP